MKTPLELILADWRRWGADLPAQPELIGPLPGGKTNQSYLLQSGSRKMVLRLNAPNSEALGINRQHEAIILQAVSEAGIAPAIYHCDPAQGFLVSEYIEGERPDYQSPETLPRLQALFDQVHSLRPSLPAFNYVQHAERYWQRLEQLGGGEHCLPDKSRLLPLLETLQAASGQGLCHHDPVAGNIIEREGRLYLLDWEYAGLGAPDFDRAAIRAEWAGFCVPTPQDDIQVAADAVYKGFCQLWQAINTG